MSRFTYVISINQDPVPGWNHQPEDFRGSLRNYLKQSIPWYDPSVDILEDSEEFDLFSEKKTELMDELHSILRHMIVPQHRTAIWKDENLEWLLANLDFDNEYHEDLDRALEVVRTLLTLSPQRNH